MTTEEYLVKRIVELEAENQQLKNDLCLGFKNYNETLNKNLKALEIIKNYGFVFAKKGQLYCGRLGDLELELDEDDFDSKEEFDLLKECFKDE